MRKEIKEKYKINLDKSYRNSDINFDFKTLALNTSEREIIGQDKINILIMKYINRTNQRREFILGKFDDEKLRNLDVREILNKITSSFIIDDESLKTDVDIKEYVDAAIENLKYDLEKKLDMEYTREGYSFLYGNKDSVMFNEMASVVVNDSHQGRNNLSFYGQTENVFSNLEDREKDLAIFEKSKHNEDFKISLNNKMKSNAEIIDEKIAKERENEKSEAIELGDIYNKFTKEERKYLELAASAYRKAKENGENPNVVQARLNVLNKYYNRLVEKHLQKNIDPKIQPI